MRQPLTWLRACIHVCTCGSGFFFYFLPLVMHYVTLLFKFKVIHLALRNKQLFTCSRISILFCLPELNTPGKVKAAGHAPSGVPLAPALHLCHGLPMLSPLQIPSRKQTNASPLTYKSVSTKYQSISKNNFYFSNIRKDCSSYSPNYFYIYLIKGSCATLTKYTEWYH